MAFEEFRKSLKLEARKKKKKSLQFSPSTELEADQKESIQAQRAESSTHRENATLKKIFRQILKIIASMIKMINLQIIS